MNVKTPKWTACLPLVAALAAGALGSIHMDAPRITLDPAANTTDVYAFVTEEEGVKYLTVALGVYPHEEPGIGPNKYNFDDEVLYQIHLSPDDDLVTGRASISYQFAFETRFKDVERILQSYLVATVKTPRGAAWPRRRSSTATRARRSSTSGTATSRSPVSATTASTRTSSRSSTS